MNSLTLLVLAAVVTSAVGFRMGGRAGLKARGLASSRLSVAAYDYAANSRYYQDTRSEVEKLEGADFEDLIGEEMVMDSWQ